MSCRHYCIDSHRNILETFLSIKNFIKHFAGIFTRSFAIKKLSFANGGQWERGLEKARSNLFYVDCHANARNDGESKSRNDKCNDEKNIVITRFCKKEILLILDCFVSLAMTNAITKVFAMIKIFNSINIGDYSLMNYSPLFIKKIY